MCGIYGLLDFKGAPVDARLKLMSEVTLHRGPDEQNWKSHSVNRKTFGFGINRLSIIDLGGGQQPISNETGTVEVVFNGEVYNHRELRTELISQGHTFKTSSDTEVLVHLYEQHGVGFLKLLRGMFAFCIYDLKKKRLFIARDRLGIKPLYYHTRRDRFAFGSEIKAITSIYSGWEVDPKAVASYFTFRYIPGPNTIYKDIQALPPAHYLEYDLRRNKIEIVRWWELPANTTTDSYPVAKERLRHLLTQAVSRRLQSEVPLGAFLSGGVDSSLLCAIVAKDLKSEINVYNIGYTEANEYGYAGQVSRDLGFNLYQCGMSFKNMSDSLPKVLRHMDQPLSDAAIFPTQYLSRVVKRGCTVMLSGEGADELFAGYWQYDGLLQARSDTGQEAYLDHLRRSSYFLNSSIIKGNSVQRVKSLWGKDKTLLSRITRFDLNTWLPDDLLMKVDKMTMAASVEARVPFLDTDLVEYGYSLPDSYKYHQGTTKRILKDVAESFGVSQEITRRPKMGFTVPLDTLLRGVFRQPFERALRSPKFKGLDRILNFPEIEKMVNLYYEGRTDLTLQVWTLFIFAAWWEAQDLW